MISKASNEGATRNFYIYRVLNLEFLSLNIVAKKRETSDERR